jgi:hypothetical protein
MFESGRLLAPTMSAVGAAARLGRALGRDVRTLTRLGPRKAAAELRALLPGAAARRSTGSGAGYAVHFPIDLVYTWVDGADPAWRARRDAAWAAANPGEHSTLAANPSRYANRDELRFALRSLAAYADWVRTVYIVTDRQLPPWLNAEHPRVQVVDHTAIFPDGEGLPTFNSHAIESRLHHIEGLAEHYLYLNDDMFFGRPCAPEDFFVGNGLARLFPSPKTVPPGPAGPADTPVEAAGKNNRELLTARFGRAPAQRFLHAPYPQLRSVLIELAEAFAADVERTTRSRFRHPTDLSIPASLSMNYAYLTARAVPGALSYAYVDLADPRLGRRLRKLRSTRPQVFCLNDHAGLGDDPAAVDAAVRAFLSAYYPDPSPFER